MYEYQPLGSITYTGIERCCCCYNPDYLEKTLENWICAACNYVPARGTITFEEICEGTRSGRLLGVNDIEFTPYKFKP